MQSWSQVRSCELSLVGLSSEVGSASDSSSYAWRNKDRKEPGTARRRCGHARGTPHTPQEEEDMVRGIAIALAITGVLAVSGIAAPAPAQAGRSASTPYGCDPKHGP